jgi:hypothetical protein
LDLIPALLNESSLMCIPLKCHNHGMSRLST